MPANLHNAQHYLQRVLDKAIDPVIAIGKHIRLHIVNKLKKRL